MSENESKQVIQIHPNAKYVLLFPHLDAREAQRVTTMLDEWWKSDRPFLVLSDKVTVQRVDDTADKPQ